MTEKSSSKEIVWKEVDVKLVRKVDTSRARIDGHAIYFSKHLNAKYEVFFPEYCKELNIFRLRPHKDGTIVLNKNLPSVKIYNTQFCRIVCDKLGIDNNKPCLIRVKIDDDCILIGKDELP